eukprot:TRINITY_DN75693_c0_g1_i1.p1 TRINITY_DN75693_c0_g1~~TRINITY_DN75693_c0_g1_i1.p1  ORF type:complete len:572 (-),score=43.61 TRINITY_DN75693_c0_g1_i1:150-1865(-)
MVAANNQAHVVLRPGVKVRLHSLQAAPELNGAFGCLREFHVDRDRWAVNVHGYPTIKLLKAHNLQIPPPGELDFANVFVDVLAEHVILHISSFLPGLTLLRFASSAPYLHGRVRNTAGLWRSLCVELLGEALVQLHVTAREGVVDDEAEFWRALFRSGYVGDKFYYANDLRQRCIHSDSLLGQAVLPSGRGGGPLLVDEQTHAASLERAFAASGHTATALGKAVVIVGGWRPHSEDACLHVSIVDLSSLTVQEPVRANDSQAPERRFRHAACAVRLSPAAQMQGRDSQADVSKCQLLIFGGCNDMSSLPCIGREALLIMEITKPDMSEIRWRTFTAVGAVPNAIWHHSACSFASGKRVVVFGGDMHPYDREFVSDRRSIRHVYVLDVDSRTWEKVATQGVVPVWRSLHSGIVCHSSIGGNDRFIVVGGSEEHTRIFGGANPVAMVPYSLDLSTMRWVCGGQRTRRESNAHDYIPQPRLRFASQKYGDNLLLFGGHNDREFATMAESPFHRLNLLTLQWRPVEVFGVAESYPFTVGAAMCGGCICGGIAIASNNFIEAVPKFDVVCLCPPSL